MSVEHPYGACRLWNIWKDMKRRCYQKGDKDYRSYGAKGIEVCAEWKSNYPAFREWALNNGYKDDLIIDRKDPTLNYEPSNCEWIPWLDNVRKNAPFITAWNETKRSYEWRDDDRCQVEDTFRINARIKKGWEPEEAIGTPVKYKKRNHSEDATSDINTNPNQDQQ